MNISFLTTPASLMNLALVDYEDIRRDIIKNIKRELKQEADTQVRKLKRLTDPWENVRPDFHYETDEDADGIKVTVYTNNLIFYFLDQGTKVRFATMTPDFIPQTSPGSLHSSGKVGDLLFVSTKRPHPGIESRRFMETLYEESRPIFIKNISEIIMEGLAQNWQRMMGR